MITRVRSWIQGLRQRRRERIAADYGTLSKHDKHVVDARRPMSGTWTEEQDTGSRPGT